MKGKRFHSIWTLVLVISVVLAVPSAAMAQSALGVVDQAFVVPNPNLWWSIQYLGPVGQEFVPNLAGADAVTLRLQDGNDLMPSTVQVILHDGTIAGPVLGTSNLVSLPDAFDGEVRFDFPTLVPLIPGHLHVIEVVLVSGGNHGVLLATGMTIGTGYEAGRPIAYGQPLQEQYLETDMLFQEGFALATPKTKDYCKDGWWQVFRRANSSPFKNQGDCIQYVNTGK